MNSIKTDSQSKFIFFMIVACQLFFANGLYLFACVTTFLILFYFVQKVYTSGVFTIILAQHILQIIAGVWLCNYLDTGINYRSPETGTATIVSLIGVIFLFIPIIYVQNHLPNITMADIKRSVNQLSTERTFYCYVISFFVAAPLEALAFSLPGLTQIIYSVIKVKWLFFLLFGYQSIIKNEKRTFFYIAIVVEFLSGFFSFFSDFKTVIYFLIVLLLTLIGSINFKQILYGLTAIILMVVMMLFWSSIKGSYRAFLNGGGKSQEVVVSNEEALDRLQSLSNDVDQNSLEGSIKNSLDRIQYTYFFAKTIERVPDLIPFQNGKNWLDNIEFCTTPRFLNPDKPTIDNSLKTSLYTGIHHLGAKSGVSFSLGYFAEFYIDFGFYGMMVGILILGAVYGRIYNYFMRRSSNNLIFNYAVVGSFFLEFITFESDGTYLLGRLLASLVTYILLINFAFPMILDFISADRINSQSEKDTEDNLNI